MKRNNPKENGVQLPFNNEEFIEKWAEWLEYRKERRLAAYVPRGLKMTFTKLINDSQNDVTIAIEMINTAMASNWQGIFPLKTLPNAANIANTSAGSKEGSVSKARIQAAKNF